MRPIVSLLVLRTSPPRMPCTSRLPSTVTEGGLVDGGVAGGLCAIAGAHARATASTVSQGLAFICTLPGQDEEMIETRTSAGKARSVDDMAPRSFGV